VRIEHWQVAADHAGALARHWMTGEESPRLIPYFWSDQYGKKIQMLGHPSALDDVVRVKDAGEGQWLALYSHDGVVTGLVALGQPRALMLSKPLLERETTLEQALALAPWAPPASA
jgi:NADPH-dependent 2,4-dienoyl-CoA reductase/sulfur reductase-like enzyme